MGRASLAHGSRARTRSSTTFVSARTRMTAGADVPPGPVLLAPLLPILAHSPFIEPLGNLLVGWRFPAGGCGTIQSIPGRPHLCRCPARGVLPPGCQGRDALQYRTRERCLLL